MNIRALMKDYMNECDDRSRSSLERNLRGLISENVELPVVAMEQMWEVVDGPERLRRKFSFESLQQRTLFLEYLMETEERNGHFAKITIEGHDVTVEVWTHSIDRVTKLDKEYASDCDSIYDDVVLVRFTGNE